MQVVARDEFSHVTAALVTLLRDRLQARLIRGGCFLLDRLETKESPHPEGAALLDFVLNLCAGVVRVVDFINDRLSGKRLSASAANGVRLQGLVVMGPSSVYIV